MAECPRPEYPRPQFVRADWTNLNGLAWTFAYDRERKGLKDGLQHAKGFCRRINVPFCPQSRLSSVGDTDFIGGMWYHRKLDIPAAWKAKKILLNFGAVDWECEIFIDGKHAGQHFGGSSSFSVDLTRFVTPGRSHDLVVRVADDLPQQPHGKQSNKRESYGCLYTRVTGIWQTVWMEAVDPRGLASCRVIPDADNGAFSFQPTFYGAAGRIAIRLLADGAYAASDEFAASDGATHVLKPSVKRLWCPEDPFLYDIVYEVKDAEGRVIDTVRSYAGLRTVRVAGNRVLLNGKPFYFRLVLDQGYYPDGIWTAPDDAALKRDIELAMAAGFNGARLHQKVFEERYHYWADRLGYVTWGENASWGASMEDDRGARNFLAEWSEIVRRDANHPSIVAWTPLNETRPGDTKAFRRGQTDLYDLTKALDPTRPVNEASGYTHWKTDLWTVHNYDHPPKLGELDQGPDKVWAYARDVTNSIAYGGQPYLNDEFGGMMWIPKGRTAYAGNTWGYGGGLKSEEDFLRLLKEEVDVQDSIPQLSGWCYTQLTDVEQEQNGVYNYDRTPKFDMRRIRAIFSGVEAGADWNLHSEWFMFAPAFVLQRLPGAASYRCTVRPEAGEPLVFGVTNAVVQIPESVWMALPQTGYVTFEARGLAADGRDLGTALVRRFWKSAAYQSGHYPPHAKPYREAALAGYDWLFRQPEIDYLLKTGTPDPSHPKNGYPTKILSALAVAMLHYAELRPANAVRARQVARAAVDWLIANSQPPQAPLAGFPPTYAFAQGNECWEKYRGQQMLLYPAYAGKAYLAYYGFSQEKRYLAAAEAIAETYVRLQGADGTWTLKVRESDGSPVGPNRLFPLGVAEFLEKMAAKTGRTAYKAAAERAVRFVMAGPVVDWNWEGQFEDVEPSRRYCNLTKHPACDTALWLLRTRPNDAGSRALARRLLTFAEDQFVCWERPYAGAVQPAQSERPGWCTHYGQWHVPSVTEQYECNVPIDASAAKLIRTYLAMYDAGKNPLSLAFGLGTS